MQARNAILATLMIIGQNAFSQTTPIFGQEINVNIRGLTFDAMEPFISSDGRTLFFNSLNSSDTTNLYYATQVNDSTFNYVGAVAGTLDNSPDHLDAVPSIDSLSNFYWTSLRDFPTQTETIYTGNYSAGSVTGLTKLFGTLNIYQPGWLVFDAAINFQGNKIYYSNAFFNPADCGVVPCVAQIGVAQKENDSVFNKQFNSNLIFSSVNDTNYIVYAPQVTKDGLELYYTRLLKGSSNTEICISVRNTTDAIFSEPSVIYSNPGFTPEAASPTIDKQKIYYHQRDQTGMYKIYLRYRSVITGLNTPINQKTFKVYPNPTTNMLYIAIDHPSQPFTASIYSSLGQELHQSMNNESINMSNFKKGTYFLIIRQNNLILTTKIFKE